ncbi:MAG: flagellar hook protein FlgE [Vibrionaceae bacterium]
MSLNIALSGLAAAQKDMSTTSNNIANANTYGFKESRAEFGDVYSTSLFSNSKTTTGGGVQTSIVAQQFHEGSSIYTNNPMDLRISGNGYFAVANDKLASQDNQLTRNGAFQLNKDNYIVNSEGQFLLGYDVDKATNQVDSYDPKALQVPEKFGQPRASKNLDVSLNLPANAQAKNVAMFDPADPGTYNKTTSSTVYDSLGQSYKFNSYYVKDVSAPNKWAVFYTIIDDEGEKSLDLANGSALAGTRVGHTLEFDTDGSVSSINDGNPIVTENFNSAGIAVNGADGTQDLSVNYEELTQYAAPFEMKKFDEDGATTGFLAKVDIDPQGTLLALYSNGENVPLGRIAMVRVANQQGLSQEGNTQWRVTQRSGTATWGEANQGSFGKIKSGVIEQSNIDMTQELVDLISAQRNFQANSRSLEVGNQMQQTILQIR